MLEMGASPNFTLFDGRRAGRKTPRNANHGWSNRNVTITEALSKSLNAPFTNIWDIMNPKPVFINTESSYRKMGIRSEERHRDMCEDTYNYPLGIRQMYVTEVAQAFQTLMNDGVCYPLRDHETGDSIIPVSIYEAKNVAVVKQALSQTVKSGTMKAYRNILPEGRTYYAKTGTSTRQQYGWGVVSDGNLLVVSLASYGKCQGDNLSLGKAPLYGGSTAGLMSVLVYNEIKKIQKP
jgi:membrane peptidoglycan carboxypeptidase